MYEAVNPLQCLGINALCYQGDINPSVTNAISTPLLPRRYQSPCYQGDINPSATKAISTPLWPRRYQPLCYQGDINPSQNLWPMELDVSLSGQQAVQASSHCGDNTAGQ